MNDQDDKDIRLLAISKIVALPELLMRTGISESVVKSYAALMNDGTVFPPLTVFWDGDSFILADGFHRLEAARLAGFSEIKCETRKGQKRDAVLFAAGANAKHGFQRSDKDKRIAVDTVLQDSEWVRWADAAIARAVGVSLPFVSNRRRRLVNANLIEEVTERIRMREGKPNILNIAGSGRSPVVPDPNKPVNLRRHWRYFLVRFTPEQFRRWQQVVNLRTDRTTLAEGVEVVMMESREQAKAS